MSGSQSMRIIIPLVVLVALVLVFGSVFTVNERELAVVVEFGKPVRGISEPGLYFKMPLTQKVRRLPKTKQFWANADNDMLVDLPTADGKKIEVSVWAIWRITDPQQFVTVLHSEDQAQKQVRQRVRAAIRNTITAYDLSEAVRSTDRRLTRLFGLDSLPLVPIEEGEDVADPAPGEEVGKIEFGREHLLQQIREQVQKELQSGDDVESGGLDRGIEVVDVGISSISFTASVRLAAFERLIAFMDSIAARHTNEGKKLQQEILNKTKADEERILGEGQEQSERIRGQIEAEIIEMYAKAIRETGDFYNFKRTLDVYQKALDSDTRLILTTDSDLFRMLKNVSPAEDETVSQP